MKQLLFTCIQIFIFSNCFSQEYHEHYAQEPSYLKKRCDCALGWPKDCDKTCGPKLLSEMSDAELRDKFMLSRESIRIIDKLKYNDNLTLENCKNRLNDYEYEKLMNGIEEVRVKLKSSFDRSDYR
jgi:hypothetical protein